MFLEPFGEKGSGAIAAEREDGASLLGRRHLLKVYADKSDRIKKDWKLNMRDEDYVGQMEFNGELPAEALPAELLRIARLIQELDDDDFAVREKATAELETQGPALPALREALERSPSAEVRHRAARILAKLNPAKLDAQRVK